LYYKTEGTTLHKEKGRKTYTLKAVQKKSSVKHINACSREKSSYFDAQFKIYFIFVFKLTKKGKRPSSTLGNRHVSRMRGGREPQDAPRGV
jgi:hypothetical protein